MALNDHHCGVILTDWKIPYKYLWENLVSSEMEIFPEHQYSVIQDSVIFLTLPDRRYEYFIDMLTLHCSCEALISLHKLLNPPETVTSQHPNRGKKISAFIIKVTKRTFDE